MQKKLNFSAPFLKEVLMQAKRKEKRNRGWHLEERVFPKHTAVQTLQQPFQGGQEGGCTEGILGVSKKI